MEEVPKIIEEMLTRSRREGRPPLPGILRILPDLSISLEEIPMGRWDDNMPWHTLAIATSHNEGFTEVLPPDSTDTAEN